MANSQHSSVLLGAEESNDGVGSDTEVVGGETGPESGNTLFGGSLADAVEHVRIRHGAIGQSLLFLHFSLDVIEGKGAAGGDHGGDHGGTNLDLEGGGIGASSLGDTLFALFVGHKHTNVKRNGSSHGGDGASPESSHTFVFHNSLESIDDILVVAALLNGEGSVSLHANKSEIAGVSNERSKGASNEGAVGLLTGAQVLDVVILLQFLGQVEVDSKTEGSVDGLSEEGGVKTAVELLGATGLVDLLGNGDGGSGATALGSELDSNLDHIDGLNL